MLFEIDQSIAAALEGAGAPDDDLIFALEKLALAYRAGAHLITGDYHTLATLKNCGRLDPRYRSIYQGIFNSFPSTAGSYSKFVRKVLVVAESGVLESLTIGERKVIRLSAALVSNSHIDNRTVFLAENLIDVDLYSCIAHAYQGHCNLGYIPLQFECIGGGGSTIASQYAMFQTNRDRLCLSVADSDRKIPTGPIGRTAHDLATVDNPSRPMCEYTLLEVREAENLIPTNMYSEMSAGNPSAIATIEFLEAVARSAHFEARHHFDIKDGLKFFEIIGPTANADHAAYWLRVLRGVGVSVPSHCRGDDACLRKEDCRCFVFQGLGSSVMERTINEVLARKPHHRLIEMIDGFLEPEWMRIGGLVTAWFCGRSAISV